MRRPEPPFPTCGTPGGWRDPWDEPINHELIRARTEAEERRQDRRAEQLGRCWQREIAAERQDQPR